MAEAILRVSGIYAIRHKISGKTYIGLSVDIHKRWRSHRLPKPTSQTAIHAAIRKYGVDAFQFEILELCEQNQLESRECFWINELDAFNTGYNLTTGGERARKVSEETKRKLSIANTGNKLGPRPESVKKKISDAQKGRPASVKAVAASVAYLTGRKQPEEWRKNAAAARTGLKRSAETKRKMSENSAFRRPEFIDLLKNNNPMHRPEARAKNSAAQKGKIISEETRLKLVEAAKRRGEVSIETRKKISIAGIGRKQSPETIAKRLLTRYGPKA